MTDMQSMDRRLEAVTLWLDPVCPFSWNTARWLRAAAEKAGFEIDLRMMNLAVLNEGRQLPSSQQARMNDSRKVGRLMAALREELGAGALVTAYFTFGQHYFDRSAAVDDQLVGQVVQAVGAHRTTAAALADAALDVAVRQSHEASQNALGDIGGSPLITMGGRTVFGPVFSSVPDPDRTLTVFDAVTALVLTPQFNQLERPRTHA
jgi:predicted DsbA family dithiol-disulfide isomerase